MTKTVIMQSSIRHVLTVIILIIFDLSALSLCFFIGYILRSWGFVDFIPVFPPMHHTFGVYASTWPVLFVWILMFIYEGLYPSIGMDFWEETKRIMRGNGVAFGIAIILTFITKTATQFSRVVIFFAFALSVALLPIMRHMARSLLMRIRLWSKDVVLVGTKIMVDQVLCNLRAHPDWGLNSIGAVLPQCESAPMEIKVLGNIEKIEEVNVKADEVIFAMPGLTNDMLTGLVEKTTRIAPIVKVLPDLSGLASAGVQAHDMRGMLLLEVEDKLLRNESRTIKRTFDAVFSLLGLVLLSPLFFLLAVLIKIDSKGPALFAHIRVGREGKKFTCYKFRTMRKNAHEELKALLSRDPELYSQWENDFKLKEDPRVTNVGKFLRRTSLDELPQLWNVFKGDMSLVGPRPIVEEEIVKYGEKARYLFKVTPGITGLWQVSGRNDADYEKRILLDEYYAKNWSLWLDVEIIIRTLGVVAKQDGAY
ncbi:MAG: undecaprenyl-phosphate galactose phosphotransferase WbaP [Firmicutes bacterium HGW-Firmicutes-13]|nr:MAG: undecaprenyl-phosphate galactose phosphotransferase WbaP [Firmicutes bacterium HGW-Firmicutes-13]